MINDILARARFDKMLLKLYKCKDDIIYGRHYISILKEDIYIDFDLYIHIRKCLHRNVYINLPMNLIYTHDQFSSTLMTHPINFVGNIRSFIAFLPKKG